MKTVYFNGIHGDTGKYAVPPRSLKDLAGYIATAGPLIRKNRAQTKYGAFVNAFRKLSPQIDPSVEEQQLERKFDPSSMDDVSQAGWGILYPKDQQAVLLKQLEPLLALRRQQAGAGYREIAYERGPDQQITQNLLAPLFGADRSQRPFYLLIVGHPYEIPFTLQYGLDRQMAVGRLALDHEEEYGNYARNVVFHESRQTPHLKTCFFGTQHPNESTTALSAQFLVKDLARRIANSFDPVRYQISTRLGEEASKLTLSKLMGGALTPDLLLTSSHGIVLPSNARDRHLRQGAPICADWPGPQDWGNNPVPERFIFSGNDVQPKANFNGMIALVYTCFGGGTPHLSSFPIEPHLSHSHESSKPFVAHLPKRMMALENGARAVIAHVDTSFVWSFTNTKKQEQTETFQLFFRELLEGRTVGYAMNVFQKTYLECLANYQELVEAQNNKQLRWQDDQLVQAWFAVNDMRNHILLGDPAVRLPTIASQS